MDQLTDRQISKQTVVKSILIKRDESKSEKEGKVV